MTETPKRAQFYETPRCRLRTLFLPASEFLVTSAGASAEESMIYDDDPYDLQ